ncbi:hypothetical protein CIK05_10035 [Bdellovibrio sp. qaytius]|nr:hypothetical protein CIK05_10035 [Bdellovibrio sp. qaytius]
MKTKSSLVMGFEIKTVRGPVLKPVSLEMWDQKSRFAEFTPHAPLKFMNDSLVGLQFHKLTNFLNAADQKPFINQAIEELCPYSTLFYSCADRLFPIQKQLKPVDEKLVQTFEKNWFAYWDAQDFSKGINFNKLDQAFDMLSEFESQMKAPLMYNFTLQFSKKFNDHLLAMYSFLFHLRSLIALDHNIHIDDSSFESVKCDSISDYLPRADFTTNDALVYWQFKKLATPFVGQKDKDIRVEKLFVEPMQRAFDQYNHNACALIDQLPQDLLSSKPNTELEQHLHQIQMDWLLGSSAGLLFRVREELFGLHHGYDKVFWTEASNQKTKKPTQFKVCFELTEQHVGAKKAA